MRVLQRVIDKRVATAGGTAIQVLDPFAGTGLIHEFYSLFVTTHGVEIEKEWAEMHARTRHGDSTRMFYFATGCFDMIVTSPTYGNRFADKHKAKDASLRRGYTHDLRALTNDQNRELQPNNTGGLPFSSKQYKELHLAVYRECWRVLKPKGWFVLNVSDFIKNFEIQPVANWHRDALIDLGFRVIEVYPVPTPRLRFGANEKARVEHEMVYVLEKP
jgi:tRNA G10  N-methylase Trm11